MTLDKNPMREGRPTPDTSTAGAPRSDPYDRFDHDIATSPYPMMPPAPVTPFGRGCRLDWAPDHAASATSGHWRFSRHRIRLVPPSMVIDAHDEPVANAHVVEINFPGEIIETMLGPVNRIVG